MTTREPTIRQQIEPHLRAAGIKPSAEATGINRVSLQRWLAGRQNLNDEQLQSLAAHLGLTIRIRPER